MRPSIRSLLFCSVAMLGPLLAATDAHAQPTPTSDPRGTWVTASGNLEVEVAPCGAALCGTVVKVLGNRSMSREGASMEPADVRPVLGMKLLQDLVREPAGDTGKAPEWYGTIYNRENGKTYKCRMSVSTEPNAAGELVLRAYVGVPLFGKTQRWQRATPAVPAASPAKP